jgi:hypothetical protein
VANTPFEDGPSGSMAPASGATQGARFEIKLPIE